MLQVELAVISCNSKTFMLLFTWFPVLSGQIARNFRLKGISGTREAGGVVRGLCPKIVHIPNPLSREIPITPNFQRGVVK
jgi:hypothetical protein